MSLPFYKVIHILGLLLVFTSLTGIWSFASAGATPRSGARKGFGIMHGLGLTAILVSGFGMLARLGILSSLPLWAHLKIGVWLALGASLALARRKASWGLPLVASWIALGTLAAYLCLYKPGG